ncbi:acyltransferase family protein [Neobacillus sp. D3-1R]|uniref:acyltransferase family protein n=1 Tax=Neobacillus sp. D3-1R TaxID=3445778 RepID=UPI003FA15D18
MKHREYYFDNAKFILIFFVVFGHFIRPLIEDNELALAIYKVIYTFHMPAFILISGFFAKGIQQQGYIQKITKKLIYPYIIFQVIYSIYYFYLYSKSDLSINFFQPHWSLWFLISLLFWHMMLLGYIKIKPIYSIIFAVLIGLLAGYVSWINSYLSLSRTFVFFPLFLIGYYLKKEQFYHLIKPKFKVLSFILILIVFTTFYVYPDINEKWLLGSKPYEALENDYVLAAIKRLGVYVISFIMVLSFFSFVPKRKLMVSKLGRNTLYVYLLHGFFVKLFRSMSVESYFHNTGFIIGLALLSLLLTLILSNKWLINTLKPLFVLKLPKFKIQ